MWYAARIAVQAGAAGIIVSNHGARQLDYVPATIMALEEVSQSDLQLIFIFYFFISSKLLLRLNVDYPFLKMFAYFIFVFTNSGCESYSGAYSCVLGWWC